MYKTSDYLKRGVKFANNILRPAHKKLATLMLYSTEHCNSKCLHCHMWEKKDKISMPLSKIIEIMQSKCIDAETTVGLEGGEIMCHPEAEAIFDWFSKNHPKFDILTNGLLPEKTIKYVRKYKPQRLFMSLDGGPEAYHHMRGVNGFHKVMTIIETLKNEIPISLMFCISPYNSFKDLEDVIEIAKNHSIDLRIGIYNNIDYFDTKETAHNFKITDNEAPDIAKDFRQFIPKSVKDTDENFDFIMLYEEWRRNHVKMKCYSITDSLVIHSNGNVPICQNLGTMLGNVNEQSLDEIFNGKQARALQKDHKNNCNKCWINFHRKMDVILLRSAEKIIPKLLIELVYGKYQWCENTKYTYSKYLKQFDYNSAKIDL